MEVIALSPEQCVELLAGESVGSVGFTTPAGERRTSVSYVSGPEMVLFRASAYSELATYAPGSEVCVVVERLDRHGRGWSVRAQGICARTEDTEERRLVVDPSDLEAWDGGIRMVALRVRWRTLTGQQSVEPQPGSEPPSTSRVERQPDPELGGPRS